MNNYHFTHDGQLYRSSSDILGPDGKPIVTILRTRSRSKRWVANTLLRFGLAGCLSANGLIVVDHILKDFQPSDDIPILVHSVPNGNVARHWFKPNGKAPYIIAGTYTYSSSSSNTPTRTDHFTWTVPTSEQLNTIKCWGAGSGGGAQATGNGYGGGGGGYSELDSQTIAAGTLIYLRVGPGGIGSDASSTAAVDGGQTWASLSLNGSDYDPTTNSCLCRGVGAVSGDTTGVGSNGYEGSVGKQFTGGNGNTSTGLFGGPGAGSSAGPAINGNNGGAPTGSPPTTGGPGGTAPAGGAAGGKGADYMGTAVDGSGPGGGGGASDGNNTNPAGDGADGQVIFITSAVTYSYSIPMIAF